MPLLRSLRRESRVTLSCVAWNGGTPFVHRGQALYDVWKCKVFSFLWLRGRMVGPFLWSWFPGCFVPLLSFLPILRLVSPVNGTTEKCWWMRRAGALKKFFFALFAFTWSWWFQTSSPCSRSWCSSCTAISCHTQRLPVGNKITSALHTVLLLKINIIFSGYNEMFMKLKANQ